LEEWLSAPPTIPRVKSADVSKTRTLAAEKEEGGKVLLEINRIASAVGHQLAALP
jgi:hypothetical protein